MAEPRFPIGQRVVLPGHFADPVILESVRPVGEGFECTVRLADGTLDEAILSRDVAAFVTEHCPGLTEGGHVSAGGTMPFARDQSPVAHGLSGGQEPTFRTTGAPRPGPTGRLLRFLGEYEILEEIARGGMGVVYRARQEKLNRVVALKVIRSGALAGVEDLRRFRQEAEVIAEFDHPHIIPVYEIGQQDDQPYFSMKFIEAGNLIRHIPRLKNDPAAAAALMAKVARAVHYAHQRTILHRDIKPSNILLDERDEPYVTDFGLAKRIGIDNETAATVTGAVMGTPAYMPPEQARGGTKSVTTAADVYGLGATLYETLTGRTPFAGDSAAEIMRQVLEQEPARLRSIDPNLDRDLETICLKCLEKEPGRRYSSAEALAEDLERWLAGMPITARPVPTWEKAVKWVKRQPALATLVIMVPLALLGLIGGGIWFTLQLWKERDMADHGYYAAGMNLTRRAVDDRLVYQAREGLEAYVTGTKALRDLRGFEWYYLANLCKRSPIRLRGHEKAVVCVAFHRDGNRVASGGTDGTVRVWDLTGRRETRVIQCAGGPVHAVTFSPDGLWLAAGNEGGDLRLWELETGRERALATHRGCVRSVVFSRDNLHLLSAEADGQIVQWKVPTGEIEFPPLQHGDRNEKLPPMVARNGSPNFGGTIAIYTPDGKSIVSVGMDQWVMIWDVATHQKRDQVRARANIMGISIRPNGRELALAEESPEIEILNLERPHGPRRSLRRANIRLGTLAFSPDERTLATAGFGASLLLDVEEGQMLDMSYEQVNLSPFSLAFGPGGRLLARAVGDEIHVVRVDPSRQGETLTAGQGQVRRLAVSSDERLLALGREDGTIVVWDVLAKRVLPTLSGHRQGVFGVAFVPGPQSALLASVGGDGLLQIWNPEGGDQRPRTLARLSGAVYALAVRPDGHQIAIGGADGLVRTWDPATGRADLPPLDHGASISALAYDPTNTALASGGMDSTVRVWSATSGRRRMGSLSHLHQLTGLAFSPNGRLLAGSGANERGGEIRIWDASSGTLSATVKCPRGVDSLSFSSDSRRIASCGSDAIVQVWDPIGGHETLSLDAGGGRVSAVLFSSSPHTMQLYSADRDGVVKLWDGSTTELSQ
jgi:eukaryotic-like serine/threonine-protein kinase